jgi:hypothetical protein
VEHFIKHFRRDPFGGWMCVKDAELEVPTGRIQVTTGSCFTIGMKFMNVDVAQMLEVEHWRQQGHPV